MPITEWNYGGLWGSTITHGTLSYRPDGHILMTALWREGSLSLEVKCLLLLSQTGGAQHTHTHCLWLDFLLFASPCCTCNAGPFCCPRQSPTLVKDMWLLPSASPAKWQRPRAESKIQRHRPQGIHLKCKSDWTRAGFVPASTRIRPAQGLS